MTGSQPFGFPNQHGRDEPLFVVGNYEVALTDLLVALGLTSLLGAAIGNADLPLAFSTVEVNAGEVWRLVTWPLHISSPGWALLSLVIFYIMGRSTEQLIGRDTFAKTIAAATLAPSLIVAAINFSSGFLPTLYGDFGNLNLALILVLTLINPRMPFLFGIPAWGLSAFFIAASTITMIAERTWGTLVFFIVMLAAVTVVIRSAGLADPSVERFVPIPKKEPKTKLTSVKTNNEVEMNQLLDKIADQGMDALSKSEKKQLKKYSQEMRDN